MYNILVVDDDKEIVKAIEKTYTNKCIRLIFIF